MATLQGLQKAIDTKSFNPNDLTEDQLLVIDDLLKTGELKGYKSIDDIITERSGAASAIAGEKQKKLQPFQQATKEAGFEVERADLELVGDVSLGAYAWLQDKDKLVNSFHSRISFSSLRVFIFFSSVLIVGSSSSICLGRGSSC